MLLHLGSAAMTKHNIRPHVHVSGKIFEWINFLPTGSTLLHGTVQILLQIALLFAIHKLAWFHKSGVNKRQMHASSCQFNNFSAPV